MDLHLFNSKMNEFSGIAVYVKTSIMVKIFCSEQYHRKLKTFFYKTWAVVYNFFSRRIGRVK